MSKMLQNSPTAICLVKKISGSSPVEPYGRRGKGNGKRRGGKGEGKGRERMGGKGRGEQGGGMLHMFKRGWTPLRNKQ